jgi:3-oxoadipate enol-lactonase
MTGDAGANLVVFPPLANDPEMLKPLDLAGLPGLAGPPRVYTYPGVGGRPRQSGFRFRDAADEMSRAASGPLDAVGLAAGAYALADLLLAAPERVRSVFIACSPPTPVGAERRAADRARAEAARPGMDQVVAATIARWFTPEAVAADAPGVRLARERLLALDPATWADFWLAIAARTTLGSAAVSAIRQPVTIVVPERDMAGGAPGLESLHRQLPLSRIVRIPGPHMVTLECPGPVREAIAGHLAWARAVSPAG